MAAKGASKTLQIKGTMIGFEEVMESIGKLPKAIQEGLKNSLIPTAKMFQETAVTTLEERTNPEYSTGQLASSIKMEFDTSGLKASIGPDGSAKNDKGESYAEWVEYGHYMTGGRKVFNALDPKTSDYSGSRWWPGHHYMGRSWSKNRMIVLKEVKASVTTRLEKYAVDARKNAVHLATGKIVGSLR